jgi:hypothetical protein
VQRPVRRCQKRPRRRPRKADRADGEEGKRLPQAKRRGKGKEAKGRLNPEARKRRAVSEQPHSAAAAALSDNQLRQTIIAAAVGWSDSCGTCPANRC